MRSSLTTSLVLALSLAVFPLLPAQHIHALTEHDGHHELLVHSHTEAHHHGDADTHAGVDADDESVVLTLDLVLGAPQAHTRAAQPQSSVVTLLPEPTVVARVRAPILIEPFNHGPPRAPAILRGPPSLSRL